jgi:Pectinesterase
MNRRLVVRIVAALLAVAMLAVPASALAGKKGGGKNKNKALVVCKHGCKYRTIQKAVNKAKKKKHAVIKIKPGKYVEGVQVLGKKYNGLTMKGTKSNPRKTILEGTNAQLPGGTGIANNGIEISDAKNVTIKNMWVRDFAGNGVHFLDSDTSDNKITCKDFLADNVDVSFNRSYGLFAFGCAGGTFENSEGWGHGDSAYYIGATPFQDNPKTTVLKNLESYENVLGYSGTNSKYLVIKDSAFYNNGIGLVPNTLDSEPFEPTGDSTIRHNDIFWNNFNYFLPASEVKTVSNGLGSVGDLTLQYPTGIGVALFGADGWTVKDNNIFGNFMWGLAEFSDPFNEGLDAVSQNNQVLNNAMGKDGTDTNGLYDFWVDGSGGGNCFSGNDSSTFAPTTDASATIGELYPECPIPNGVQPNAGASGNSNGNINMVYNQLVPYVTTDPPENQECSWAQHPHPAFKDYEPLDVTPGPDCP